MKIGIVGNGFVGSAVAHGFKEYYPVRVYDSCKERSCNTLEEVLECEVVFACLPTPYSTKTGTCDVSIIESFLTQAYTMGFNETIAIKSTTPPGTCQRWFGKYGGKFNVVHNPEFLTERCAKIDFVTPSRIVIGGYSRNLEEIYESRFPSVPIIRCTATESELIKLLCNAFFASKVALFNEFFDITKQHGGYWPTIMQGILSDGRIAHSHTNVPGPDGSRGFGGKCFPKDINMLVASSYPYSADLLKQVWRSNLVYRERKDWLEIDGAWE